MCIPRRFNGPPASANGGVASGPVAARLGPGPVSVTLRRPQPLGVSLPVERVAAGRVTVTHDGALVAEASVAAAPDDVEAPVRAELLAPVHVGEELIATGWPLETAGRKHYSASALLRPDGTLAARARALWIRLTAPLA